MFGQKKKIKNTHSPFGHLIWNFREAYTSFAFLQCRLLSRKNNTSHQHLGIHTNRARFTDIFALEFFTILHLTPHDIDISCGAARDHHIQNPILIFCHDMLRWYVPDEVQFLHFNSLSSSDLWSLSLGVGDRT